MKITVFGATGRIGFEIVKQALAAGHHVTAVVRDPQQLAIRADRLEVVVADTFDGEAIVPAVKAPAPPAPPPSAATRPRRSAGRCGRPAYGA